ncbi:hypothetical protein [Cryobacterium sp. PH31-O1]|uniref:hypothetical protein n=1 Tax=Cryobacterium sp. PH31-O1 TaxID=3046306 RepID=UPI0024B8AABC|nr:hypothetical protein [Cryobacterium sp. PH31-O1]MDJ0336656.1 hypothetical protein [Cryobacterium sp. PH31-O1]
MTAWDVAASTDVEATVMATPPAPQFRWASIVMDLDASSERVRESLALGVGAIALAVAALITLILFRLQPLPITGNGSIGQYGAAISGFVAIAAFIGGRWVMPLPAGTCRALNVADVLALAFAHAVIALVTWTLLAELIQSGFIDALVFGLPSMLIAGTMAAVTAYVVFSSATHMNLVSLAMVLSLFLVAGVIFNAAAVRRDFRGEERWRA